MKTIVKADITVAAISEALVTYKSGGNNLEEVRLS